MAGLLLALALLLGGAGVAGAQTAAGGTDARTTAGPAAAAARTTGTALPAQTTTRAAFPTPAGSTDPNGVTSPTDRDTPPAGHRLTAAQAEAIARADPKAAKVRRGTKGSYDSIFLKGQTRWQLSIYAPGKPLREIGQVIVDDASGKVTESWDGPYVAWTMARGYDGAFGRSITNPWLWALLCVLFLVPFVSVRPLRGPPLAFLAVAGFSAPLAFFNNARLDWAVPLSFALLLGLFAWSTWRGLRRPRRAPRDLLIGLPVAGLVLLGVALLAFRIVLNVTDGNVIDVGYASVVGADRIGHGQSLYGVFPKDVGRGDTYGPLTYLAYVPFEQLFPWSGRWDDLPAAHAAAIGFDVLTAGLLWLVGRRQETDPVAGRRRGVLYAYLWLACPWTAYCLNSNANDALVAVAMALLLAFGARPFGRGLAAGAAGAAKIAPFAVLPVLATRRRVAPTVAVEHGRPAWRPVIGVALGAAVVVLVTGLVVLRGEPVRLLLDRTVGYQAGRDAPFMPWGYYDLGAARDVVRVLAVGFALLVAVLPRRHDLTGTAAIVLAVLLGLQMATEYWFYLYLTWLLPLIFVAAAGDRPLRWLVSRDPRETVVPRMHGPLPKEDAPWAAGAPDGA
ncbi:glycosyltransferase 87 family protein [Patulibacter sp. SYSU D01012]|uniref:glycosyltransferase 87 family protein n=1 Tax=Patulibacter sp. SYSU D01012 TaxID=2817381 RepID=UPI001B307B7F|nr:glycosyltransferase 87 family protein [Patulibacter sp. SYSU D01012]